MYEDKTFENILEDMLEHVREDVDKREGSIIYDALAPAAYYCAEMFFLLAHYPDLLLPDTAVEEYLDRFTAAFGITRKQAVKAVRKVTAARELELGTRWQIQDVTYKIVAALEEGEYSAECGQAGAIGNAYFGILSPVGNIDAGEVKLGEILTAGSDRETDDAFRERFLTSVKKPSTSGNVYDYYNWAMSCEGVGAVKVFPLAEGPGTVKLVLASKEKTAVEEAVVLRTKKYVDNVRPVGADVTVVSAADKVITVNARVKLGTGRFLAAVQAAFEESLKRFLREQSFEASYVSAARIGNLLMEVEGVEDYTALTLNGEAGNIALAREEVAVAGTVRLEVM